jgi:hypothetical protein
MSHQPRRNQKNRAGQKPVRGNYRYPDGGVASRYRFPYTPAPLKSLLNIAQAAQNTAEPGAKPKNPSAAVLEQARFPYIVMLPVVLRNQYAIRYSSRFKSLTVQRSTCKVQAGLNFRCLEATFFRNPYDFSG